MKNSRAQAVEIILAVLQGASLSEVLPQKLQSVTDLRDKAFIQALSYGICRWYFYLDALAKLLLKKPVREEKSRYLYFNSSRSISTAGYARTGACCSE